MSPPSTPATSSSAQQALDSSILPFTQAGDDVTFPLVDDSGHADHHDEEAALEALRAAISGSHDDGGQDAAGASTLQSSVEGDLGTPTLIPASQVQVQSMDKAVAQLQQLSAASSQIIETMNAPSLLQGLLGSFKLLVDSNRRQAELVKNLVDSIQGRGPPTIDPSLSVAYVPRSEYDALKARYEALVSTSSMPTARRARSVMKSAATLDEAEDGRMRDLGSSTPFGDDDKRLGRKRRSMKLEHLVHKMANRRLGVEYPVSNFEVKGSRDLPDPSSMPPMAEESINGVQEFRPDFRGDQMSSTVRPFIDTVVADVRGAWTDSYAAEEPEVDDEQIVKAVNTYWLRLSKRYDEQLARDRGEVHKDELTRRKQNQYRRQQSLVARRTAAFDTSPLNLCKLRALYRTLLTIDFAAMTNERPDPKREYTADEWYAYRKRQCGSRAGEAHEIVDQFWLSANARNLLNILDIYATDQASKLRRKGRPKQPAPTFHLPPHLWDRSFLPTLRHKDAQGLPVSGGSGIILFKFHVDEKVQEQFPDWALGLYDNPPVPDEDRLLPNLPDVMNANAFYHLKPRIRLARDASIVPHLMPEEVREILDRDENEDTSAAIAAAAAVADEVNSQAFDLNSVSSDFITTRGLESIVALASGSLMNPFASPSAPAASTAPPLAPQSAHPLMSLGLDAAAAHGPSPGSSVRARRQAKRMMSEVPGGAATPVPRKRRREGEPEPEVDIDGDASFLDAL